MTRNARKCASGGVESLRYRPENLRERRAFAAPFRVTTASSGRPFGAAGAARFPFPESLHGSGAAGLFPPDRIMGKAGNKVGVSVGFRRGDSGTALPSRIGALAIMALAHDPHIFNPALQSQLYDQFLKFLLERVWNIRCEKFVDELFPSMPSIRRFGSS